MSYYSDLDNEIGMEIDGRIDDMNSQYDKNKSAKVKTVLNCPVCHNAFNKKSYQQAFCSSRCKDHFWNVTDDARRERASRFF